MAEDERVRQSLALCHSLYSSLASSSSITRRKKTNNRVLAMNTPLVPSIDGRHSQVWSFDSDDDDVNLSKSASTTHVVQLMKRTARSCKSSKEKDDENTHLQLQLQLVVLAIDQVMNEVRCDGPFRCTLRSRHVHAFGFGPFRARSGAHFTYGGARTQHGQRYDARQGAPGLQHVRTLLHDWWSPSYRKGRGPEGRRGDRWVLRASNNVRAGAKFSR
jgi:hypothetical protein